MPNVNILDPAGYLRSSGMYSINFSRCLALLARATAPAPGSRYQANSIWVLAKYAQVNDPRITGPAAADFVVNTGIADLDPHQKTVLSDDVGVALSLGILDQQYGILGLADVYQLVSQGKLLLANGGRHRAMPDYLIYLRRPFNGCNAVLLECKGSQTAGQHLSQIRKACQTQLPNIAPVTHGGTAVPRIVLASQLLRGGVPHIHVSDPPEPFDSDADIESVLKMNWLALEYSLFQDFSTAEEVWTDSGMSGWGISRADDVTRASRPINTWKERVPIHLLPTPQRRSSSRDQDEVARLQVGPLAGMEVRGTVSVTLEPTQSARELREHKNWKDLPESEGDFGSETEPEDVYVESKKRKVRKDVGRTYSGMQAEIEIDLTPDF